MKCPRCGKELKTIEYERVEIETCPGCEGEWLNGGELKRIVDTVEKTFSNEHLAILDRVNRNIFALDDSDTALLLCPRCGDVKLNRFNYAATSGVALDKCPGCEGIWLDKDELEHVQILAEEWRNNLEENREKYAPLLEKIKAEVEESLGESVSVSRSGIVNSIARLFYLGFRSVRGGGPFDTSSKGR